MKTYDVGIIGGGIVGTAIAFGELLRGKSVVVLDGSNDDRKASFANFGLVWVQGKGVDMPDYQLLTRKSLELWPDFVERLETISGISIEHEQEGGLTLCFSDEEYEERPKQLEKLQKALGFETDWEMIGRNETQKRIGDMALGPKVVGASYSHRDGTVNPLLLSRALIIAIDRLGGKYVRNNQVTSLNEKLDSWEILSLNNSVTVGSVFVAAGLGTKKIVENIGVNLPISADKGQILVSERLPKSMYLPARGIRQTPNGSFLFGGTKEGDRDRRSTIAAALKIAKRAIDVFPELKHVKIVRQWAGHRIITPDGYPIYEQPRKNLSIAVCHSGITLAALHSSDWTDDPKIFQQFSKSRFEASASS